MDQIKNETERKEGWMIYLYVCIFEWMNAIKYKHYRATRSGHMTEKEQTAIVST